MRFGFIGLGNMGGPMACNLLAKGADLTVYNRTPSKSGELVARGAKDAASPADLTRRVDVVLSCLRDVETSRRVFLGPDGVIDNALPGVVLVDHATVDPGTSLDCAQAAADRGASFLDAPISGGHTGAADGTLAIMVGGETAAFDKVRPYFEMMGSNVRLMGASGAGTATKLINQLLVASHSVAAAEAFVLAERAGIDIAALAEMLMVSWGGSTLLARNAPITRAREFEVSASPLRNLTKDLRIIFDMTESLGLTLPVGEAAADVMRETEEAGYGGGDIAAAVETIEKRKRVQRRRPGA